MIYISSTCYGNCQSLLHSITVKLNKWLVLRILKVVSQSKHIWNLVQFETWGRTMSRQKHICRMTADISTHWLAPSYLTQMNNEYVRSCLIVARNHFICLEPCWTGPPPMWSHCNVSSCLTTSECDWGEPVWSNWSPGVTSPCITQWSNIIFIKI